MSETRRRCLATMVKSEMKVVLVTPENLSRFILPEAPLHEGYQYLSETLKSDYLRAYFMHFYGGGYSDIKNTSQSWLPSLKQINQDCKIYANGYREVGEYGVPILKDKEMNNILHSRWYTLIGNGAFLMRPRTIFTEEWYAAMIKVMDERLEMLKRYPSNRPQAEYSPEYPFPFEWGDLQAKIFHPIVYKYRHNILQTLPPPKFTDYR